MSELSKIYNPQETESKWYAHWMNEKFFKSVPDERPPYTIVIPSAQCNRSITHGAYAQQHYSRCAYP